jgi:hypothetical protein
LYSDDLTNKAQQFSFKKQKYHYDFVVLLTKIYQSSQKLQNSAVVLPKNENIIRNILVDEYLSKEITEYKFKKEENNNLGRVDIYIVNKLDNSEPNFIIECKLLNDKNVNGIEGFNAKYIENGIKRFLIEHYYLDNNFYTNAMVGFVVSSLDIAKNISSINRLSDKLFKNIVEIKQEITLDKNDIYKSIYKTYAGGEKEFTLYHLMLNFAKNTTNPKDNNQKCMKKS